MNFGRMIGQKEVIRTLQNILQSQRVGHAFVFTGPAGIGKKMAAEIFAEMLLCGQAGKEASCGNCMSCRMFDNQSNPDFYRISQGDASIGVEEIRKLQKDISIKPLYSERKIYLIEEAENMTVQAQNCLLKVLEEPPAFSVILLTTANYDALLETVRSRLFRINFRKNTPEEVREALERQKISFSDEIEFLISYADGIIGEALNLANSKDFIPIREKTLEIILQNLNMGKLIQVFENFDFFDANKNNIELILDIMTLFYRDCLLFQKTGDENILINSDKKDIILKNICRISSRKLIENIEEIERTRGYIRQNANYQLSIEVMLMKLQEESNTW